MAITTKEKIIFLKASKGKLVNKKAGISADSVTGMLLGIRKYESVFPDGKTQWNYHVIMQDGEEKYSIQMNCYSFTPAGFFSRAHNINLELPLELGVYSPKDAKAGQTPPTYVVLRQGGKVVGYSKEFPQPDKKVINGTKTNDFAPVNVECDRIMQVINTKLGFDATKPTVTTGVAIADHDVIPSELSTEDEIPF